MEIKNESDIKPIDDICGPLNELFWSEKQSLATVVIKSGKKAGRHYHNLLEEAYYILEGNGKIHIGNECYDVKKGDVIQIPLGTYHCLENPYQKEMKVLVSCAPGFTLSDVLT